MPTLTPPAPSPKKDRGCMIRINRQLHQQIMAAAKDQGVTAGTYLYHVLHTYWSQNGTAPVSPNTDNTKTSD